MKVLVASTIPPWKTGQGTLAWLSNAEAMVDYAEKDNHEVHFFCAFEIDGRGMVPYTRLLNRIETLHRSLIPFAIWHFMVDDGAKEYESGNRLFRICTGRNAAQEFAMVNFYDAILFLDTDILPQPDCIPRLLEIDHPIVGGDVPAVLPEWHKSSSRPLWAEDRSRGLFGYVPDGAKVEQHWNTAGFLMIRREVFVNLAWHYNLDANCTDDPTYQGDAVKLGYGQTWVRKDVVGIHVEPLIPVELRPEDRTYYRV